MKHPMIGLLFGIAIVAFTGAGCEWRTHSSTPSPSQVGARIDVPQLGFSYVPFTSDSTVFSGGTVTGTRLIFSRDTQEFRSFDYIERVPRQAGQSVEDALLAFMKSTGGSSKRCALQTTTSTEGEAHWLSGGWRVVTLVPRATYQPTTAEVYASLRKNGHNGASITDLKKICETSPECKVEKENLIQARNVALCGPYSVSPHYQVGSQFIVDPKQDSVLLYVHTTGGGDRPIFDGGPIQILSR
jgi:hypothetical protein